MSSRSPRPLRRCEGGARGGCPCAPVSSTPSAWSRPHAPLRAGVSSALGGRGLPPGLALLLALTAPLSSDLGAVWGWMGIYVPPLMRKYPLC